MMIYCLYRERGGDTKRQIDRLKYKAKRFKIEIARLKQIGQIFRERETEKGRQGQIDR
jgi:hypothetical protein